ncbi:MAG: hypothetical protein JKY86_15420 [Gammaproteobacteria bacterium]|nr:hypothetical protein [Gammaproteobacteria bacterium]
MNVAVCNDSNYVKSVIFDPEMWGRCTDDYAVKDESLVDGLGCLWLKCYDDDTDFGLASVSHGGNSTIDIHIHIPKENRGRKSKEIGLSFLSWVKCNAISEVYKINTKVPAIYKDVIRFAHSLGFKDEGIDTKSIMKNGKLIDRVCLGISITEVCK